MRPNKSKRTRSDNFFGRPYSERWAEGDSRAPFRDDLPLISPGGDSYRPSYPPSRKHSCQTTMSSPLSGPPTPQTAAPMASMTAVPTGPQQITEADRDDNEFMKLLSEFSNAMTDESTARAKRLLVEQAVRSAQEIYEGKFKAYGDNPGFADLLKKSKTKREECQAEADACQAAVDKCSKATGEKVNGLCDAWRRMRHSGNDEGQTKAIEELWGRLNELSEQWQSDNRFERLRGQLEAVRQHVDDLSPNIASLESRYGTLHADVTTFGTQIISQSHDLKSHKAEANTRSDLLQKNFDNLLDAITSLRTDNEARDKSIGHCQQRLSMVEKKVDGFDERLTSLDVPHENTMSSATATNMESKISELQSTVTILKDYVEAGEEDIGKHIEETNQAMSSEFDGRLASLERSLKARMEERQRQTEELLKDQLQGLKEENKQLKMGLANLEKINSHLQEKAASASVRLDAVQNETSSHRQSLQKHTAELTSLKSSQRPSSATSPASTTVHSHLNSGPNGLSTSGVAIDERLKKVENGFRALNEQMYFLYDRYNNTTTEQLAELMLQQLHKLYPVSASKKHGDQLQQHALLLQELPQLRAIVSELSARADHARQSQSQSQSPDSIPFVGRVSAFDELKTKITQLEKDQSTINERLPALMAKVEALADAIGKSVTAFKKDIETLSGKHAAHETELGDLQTDVNTMKEQPQVAAGSDDIMDRLESMQQNNQKLKQTVEESMTQANTDRSRLEEHGSQIRSLETRVKDCEAKGVPLAKRIGDCEAKSSALETQSDQNELRTTKRLDEHRTGVDKRLSEHAAATDRRLSEQKAGLEKGAYEHKTNVTNSLERHKAECIKVIDENKITWAKGLNVHKADTDKKLEQHRKEVESAVDLHKTEIDEQMSSNQTTLDERLGHSKMDVDKRLDIHESATEERIDKLEQHIANNRRVATSTPEVGRALQPSPPEKDPTTAPASSAKLPRVPVSDKQRSSNKPQLQNADTFDVPSLPALRPADLPFNGRNKPEPPFTGPNDIGVLRKRKGASHSRPPTGSPLVKVVPNKRERSSSSGSLAEPKKRKTNSNGNGMQRLNTSSVVDEGHHNKDVTARGVRDQSELAKSPDNEVHESSATNFSYPGVKMSLGPSEASPSRVGTTSTPLAAFKSGQFKAGAEEAAGEILGSYVYSFVAYHFLGKGLDGHDTDFWHSMNFIFQENGPNAHFELDTFFKKVQESKDPKADACKRVLASLED